MKDKGVYELLCAALAAYRGEVIGGSGAVGRPVSGLYPRMIEALQYTARGLTMKETAAKMGIGAPTVNKYLLEARKQFGAKNNPHLVYLAMKAGLLH